MELQAQIPTALCTVHNFICMHDSTNIPTNKASDEDDEDWQGEYSGANDDDDNDDDNEEEEEENNDIVAIKEDNKIEFHQ